MGLPPWNKGKKGLQKAWNKGKPSSDEWRRKLSETKKRKIREDRKFYETLKDRLLTKAHPQLKNPEVQRRRFKAIVKKPNQKEETLIKLFQQHSLPFKYVGDGDLLIACKCPDFVNTENGKQLIELFGNYWHNHEEVEKRKAIFAQYGFETLIIWENELQNEDNVVAKVREFMLGCQHNAAQSGLTTTILIL